MVRGTIPPLSSLATAALLGVLVTSAGACRVADTDVKRWENTQHGPAKLVAVITHDKYSWDLRTEAALSLVRMPPRAGVRQGIGYLIERYKDEDGEQHDGALNQVSDDARRQIVDRMAPELIRSLDPPPPARGTDGRLPTDPTVPFKDATFALLIHEPSLVSNDATRQALRAALVHWAQTGFEDRIENGSQQYGLEQMMKYLGPESVKALPGSISESTLRLDRIAGLINDVGDDATKTAGSAALAQLASKYQSKDWLDAQTKLVKASNERNNIKADDSQVAGQVDKIQERRLTEEVFPAMKRVGGRPSIDYLLGYAANNAMPQERRKLALAALEGRVDKSNPQDLERLFNIAKNDDVPDGVRDVAFARLGELPKEQIVPKLWTLFDAKKWKSRWEAGELVLKTMTTRQIPDFMSHLPKSTSSKMGMTEGLSYGGIIRKMEPAPGDPKPRDVITPFLTSKDIGPRLTALGYFWDGKKDERSAVEGFQNDTAALPKCDPADDCQWQCNVPKSPPDPKDPKATDVKEIKTVGDLVKLCLLPTMDK